MTVEGEFRSFFFRVEYQHAVSVEAELVAQVL